MAEHSLTCRGCGKQFRYHRRKAYCRPECRATFPQYNAGMCEGCGKCPPWRTGLCRGCSVLSRKIRRKQYERDKERAGRPPVVIDREPTTPATRVERECIVCGKGFFPKKAANAKCCGRECGLAFTSMQSALRATGGRVWVRSPLRRKCEACGSRFVGSGKHCSQEQQSALYAPIVIATCRWCKGEFSRAMQGASRWLCSEACRASSRSAAERRRKKSPAAIAYRKADKKRRKALARGANDAERVCPDRVFERDGWRCGICGKKTLPSKRGTYHPRAPELDHIVAIALGGPHTYANTMTACRSCNIRKGAAALGQLPLFPRG